MQKLFRLLLIVLVVVGAVYYSIIKFVVPAYLQQAPGVVSNLANDYINGTINIARLEWNGGLEITAKDVQVKDKRMKAVAVLPEVKIEVAPWKALFNTKKALDKIIINDPQIYLTLNEEELWNVQDLLKPSDSEETPFYGVVKINKGKVHVKTVYGQWDFGLTGNVDASGNPHFALDAKLSHEGDELALKGLVDMKAIGKLTLKSEQFNLSAFASLAKEFGKVSEFSGALGGINLLWQNDGKNIFVSGQGTLEKVSGLVFVAERELPVVIDGKIKFNDNSAETDKVEILIDKEKLELSGDVNFKDPKNIQGQGQLKADAISFKNEVFKKILVPFRIVDNKVQINTASAEVDDGRANFLAEYDINSGNIVAALDLENIKTQMLTEYPQGVLSVDGSIALKGIALKEKVELNVASNMLRMGLNNLLLYQVAFDADLSSEGCEVNNISAFTDTGAFLAQGNISKAGLLDFRGTVTNFQIGPLAQILGQDVAGILAADVTITGTLDSPNVTGNTQVKEFVMQGLKIQEASGPINFSNGLLQLNNYHIFMEQGQSVINGQVDLSASEPKFDLEIITEGVRAEPFVNIAEPEVKITGNVNNRMHLTGTVSNPSVIGELVLTDGSAEGYLIDKIATDYSYINNEIIINNCEIISLSTKATLQGKMDKDKKINFKVDLEDIDLSVIPVSDDTVSLTGYADAHGVLTGTLDKPYFRGDVGSKVMFVNGEELTDLEFELTSDGGIDNHLEGSFKQEPSGTYSANLDYNSQQKFLRGRIVATDGNVSSIFKMLKTNYEICGLAQGKVDINPNGLKSGIFVDVSVDNLSINKLKYDAMIFKGHLQEQIWHFDDVKMLEHKGVDDKGIIAIGGSVNLEDGSLELEAGAIGANPAIATAFMAEPIVLTGDLNMFVQLKGTIKDPQGNGSIEVKNGSAAGIGFDGFTAMVSLENDNLKLEQAMLSKDIYSMSAYGDVPLDIFRDKSQRKDINSQMNVLLNLENTSLGVLPLISPIFEWGVGETQGQVKLAGTLEDPLVYGTIQIPEGSIKIKQVRTVIENIHTDIEFEGNKVTLKDISAKLGKGSFKGSGTYALRSNEKEPYKLELVADNAEVVSDIFTGRINGNVNVTSQRHRIRKGDTNDNGGMTNKENDYGYRPLVKGEIRLDDVLINMPMIPEFGEGESNIGLDLQLSLGPKIHLYNKYLYDLWLAGGLNIQGSTRFINIGGTITAKKGTVNYLRTQFKVQSGSVSWPIPGNIFPTVNLEARTKFQRYDIGMRITGPLEEMDLQLTSSPPLTKDQIVRMLTLQREVLSSEGMDNDDLQNLMTAGLQMAIFGDVENLFKSALGLDEFRVYSGKIRNGLEIDTYSSRDFTQDERNQYNVLFSKYLTDNFMIGYTTSMDNDHHSVFGQYEISKHLNINYSLNEKNEKWYGVEYRLTF